MGCGRQEGGGGKVLLHSTAMTARHMTMESELKTADAKYSRFHCDQMASQSPSGCSVLPPPGRAVELVTCAVTVPAMPLRPRISPSCRHRAFDASAIEKVLRFRR